MLGVPGVFTGLFGEVLSLPCGLLGLVQCLLSVCRSILGDLAGGQRRLELAVQALSIAAVCFNSRSGCSQLGFGLSEVATQAVRFAAHLA